MSINEYFETPEEDRLDAEFTAALTSANPELKRELVKEASRSLRARDQRWATRLARLIESMDAT